MATRCAAVRSGTFTCPDKIVINVNLKEKRKIKMLRFFHRSKKTASKTSEKNSILKRKIYKSGVLGVQFTILLLPILHLRLLPIHLLLRISRLFFTSQ